MCTSRWLEMVFVAVEGIPTTLHPHRSLPCGETLQDLSGRSQYRFIVEASN